jgi:hypothetical protein
MNTSIRSHPSLTSAFAESVIECSVCHTRIKTCDFCGTLFGNDDPIIEAVFLVNLDPLPGYNVTLHFCSDQCLEDYLNPAVKEVPA